MTTPLADRHCVALAKGTPPLNAEQAKSWLGELHKDWALDMEAGIINRTFAFNNYYETIAFVNALAWIANTEDHHPDLEVSYNRCVVNFSTHMIGGLSENDFICAARADALIPESNG